MKVPGLLHKSQICEKSPVNIRTYTIIKHIQSTFTQKSSNMQKKKKKQILLANASTMSTWGSEERVRKEANTQARLVGRGCIPMWNWWTEQRKRNQFNTATKLRMPTEIRKIRVWGVRILREWVWRSLGCHPLQQIFKWDTNLGQRQALSFGLCTWAALPRIVHQGAGLILVTWFPKCFSFLVIA